MTARRVACGLALLACACARDTEGPTFTRDIAPIVFENCSGCHRPGESGPFDLLTYRDVHRRAEQVAEVVRSGLMPPWLPEPGEHAFAGERGLSEDQIATIERWVRAGAPEGAARELPPRPSWSEGWQLGEPDLVVTLERPYTLPAEGTDVFRNLVIPVPVAGTRWVEALELRPGNKRIVHHAVVQIDRTPATRRLDGHEGEPGFDGMEMGYSLPPDGHFIGWTPGKTPTPPREGLAWRLDRGTDLVIQLHLLPTGRPESIQPSVGLHFAAAAPARPSSVIGLYIENIDIPPGEKRHIREDRFRLPVPVEVVAVYPHAHYLGKEVRGFAVLPDRSETELIRIDDWNFNWQDDYRYEAPVALPAGAEIVLRWVYDNSRDNVRNPHYPPRRVQSGNQSSDEMGSLMLQALVRDDRERALLAEAQARDQLAVLPDSWRDMNNLGNALADLGRPAEAIDWYERALELRPDLDDARYNLGIALFETGESERAIAAFREVLRLNPDHAKAHNNLGHSLLERHRVDDAIAEFRRAIELQPSLEVAHYNLGNALLALDRPAEAAAAFRAAIEVNPRYAMAHNNLGTALHVLGRIDEAIAAYEAALAIDPGLAEARTNLGIALAAADR